MKPADEGGSTARSGFNYQDEIAVSFLIDMLEDPSLLKVHCETHDDILLIRLTDGPRRLAEFIQVKAGEPNKLWSVADLCTRKKGKVGSSLFEFSLERDRHQEDSRFRIVTLRPVMSELKVLTFPLGASGREVGGERFNALRSALEKKFPRLKSEKGNGPAFWIEHCIWDQRHSEDLVRQTNLLRLIRLSEREGCPLLPEHAEVLLDELRNTAKTAGDAKWEPNKDVKIILRAELREWWERRLRELIDGASSPSGGKLKEKMATAGLPDETIRLAVEMRMDYAAAARTPLYMDQDERHRLQRLVKSELMSLQARLVSGQLNLGPAAFHALCLQRLDKVSGGLQGGTADRSAFLKGCMYDITDRCLHRFAKSA